MGQGRNWWSIAAGIYLSASTATAFAADDSSQFREKFGPFLTKHCVACHSGEKPKGNLNLEKLPHDLADTTTRGYWTAVVERLEAGDMPPAEKPRPEANEIKALTAWLSPRVAAAETAARAAQGRVVLRRLNRIEYENTVRDLLGVQVSLKEQLPLDSSADGFDNAGAAHHTSSFLMEKYLEAADAALNMAISNRPKPPTLISKRYSIKDGHPVKHTTEDVYRITEDGQVVCFCSSEWHNVSASTFYPQDGGNYRFRISASTIQSDKPVTFRVTASGTRLTGMSGLVSYFDAPVGEPRIFEFTRHMEPRTTISMLPYGLAGANTVKQMGAEKWEGPGLAIQYIDIEGPLYDSWPPESHMRLFGDLAQKNFPAYNFRERVEVVSDQPQVDALRILKAFAKRAFRRNVTDADVAPYLAIAQTKIDGGYTFEQAMRAAFKGIMIAPDFLFLQEKPGKLDDFALACRLSYFLWSTMPDEELAALAEEGKLRDAQVLHEQIERLLNSPKSKMFTENFVGQWLGLREIDSTSILSSITC
jgi:mono/diheme cytochrome c family protein